MLPCYPKVIFLYFAAWISGYVSKPNPYLQIDSYSLPFSRQGNDWLNLRATKDHHEGFTSRYADLTLETMFMHCLTRLHTWLVCQSALHDKILYDLISEFLEYLCRKKMMRKIKVLFSPFLFVLERLVAIISTVLTVLIKIAVYNVYCTFTFTSPYI